MTNKSRVIAISGATSGIGNATLVKCIEKSHSVIFGGRDIEKIKLIEEMFNGDKKKVYGFLGDILDKNYFSKIIACANENQLQAPDAFILCAGRGLPGSIRTSDELQWPNLIETNFLAILNQLRSCGNYFSLQEERAQPKDIIVIGSTVGRNLSSSNPVYGATKAATHYLVESLRQELSSINVRVSLIEPGFVKTEFQERAGYDMQWFAKMEEECGPFLTGSDIAEAICFVMEQPAHVHVDDIRIRPTRQKV